MVSASGSGTVLSRAISARGISSRICFSARSVGCASVRGVGGGGSGYLDVSVPYGGGGGGGWWVVGGWGGGVGVGGGG